MNLALAALALTVGLELAFGEPPARAHPVAWFGRAVEYVDHEWAHPRVAGFVVVFVLPLLAASVVVFSVFLTTLIHPVVGIITVGLALFSATSLRMLIEIAHEVIVESERDTEHARELLLALAGRDASELTPKEIRSAATESAAENLADGLVAPLFAFSLLAPVSLPLAAGGAVWVKSVNTLDSMLGYPEKPHGSASARLDDLVMWGSARASALLIALSSAKPRALTRAREWAKAPPSPNSGWPMATLASVLDCRLEKPGVYVLNPSKELPTAPEARHGVRVVALSGVLSYLLAGVALWF
jgi:adenosylcobinamide-phosphate synthase